MKERLKLFVSGSEICILYSGLDETSRATGYIGEHLDGDCRRGKIHLKESIGLMKVRCTGCNLDRNTGRSRVENIGQVGSIIPIRTNTPRTTEWGPEAVTAPA